MAISSPAESRSVPREEHAQARVANRLFFIDNIRVFLTILVILHHLMVIYAGSGSWIYNEKRQDETTAALGEWFCSINQSYFMGLFLFISAYFVPGSYERKGPRRFLTERLIRLGIPLVVYAWIIRPFWIFYNWSIKGSFWSWYSGEYFKHYGILGGGPLWFIEVLLIFAFLYVLYRLTFAARPIHPISKAGFPRDRFIVLFALLLGVITSLVRLWFPRDTSFVPLNLQFANFAQYVALFVLGLVAYPRNWLVNLPDKTGRRWLIIVLILATLPLLVAFDRNPRPETGVWLVEELVSALWESFMCLGMCISLLYLFRRHADQQGQLMGWLSRNAYTAYLIHEPVITSIALAIASVAFYPLLKFTLMGVVTIPLTFLLSTPIRNIPYSDHVL